MDSKINAELSSMTYESKKKFLIELLTEAWELWDDIDRNSLDESAVDEILDVIYTEDEDERVAKIEGYKKRELEEMKIHHDNLMQIIQQIYMFDIKMREYMSNQQDQGDLDKLEGETLDL